MFDKFGPKVYQPVKKSSNSNLYVCVRFRDLILCSDVRDIAAKISAAMQRSQVPPLLRNVNTRTVGVSLMLGLKMDFNLCACHNVPICYCPSPWLSTGAWFGYGWNSVNSIVIESITLLITDTLACMILTRENNFLKAYQESDRSMMRRSLGSCRRLHFMQAWHPDLETTTLDIQTQHHNLCIVYFRSAHSAAVFLTRPHDAELRAVFQPRVPASDCSGMYRPLHRAVSWLTVTFSFNA